MRVRLTLVAVGLALAVVAGCSTNDSDAGEAESSFASVPFSGWPEALEDRADLFLAIAPHRADGVAEEVLSEACRTEARSLGSFQAWYVEKHPGIEWGSARTTGVVVNEAGNTADVAWSFEGNSGAPATA